MTRREGDGADALRVRGGAGGTTACLTALITGAIRAERAAGHLADAGRAAGRAAGAVSRTSAASPVTAARAEASVLQLLEGPNGLPRCAETLGTVAAALRTTAETYVRADQSSAALMRIPMALGRAVGEAGPVAVLSVGLMGFTGLVVGADAVVAARLLRNSPSAAGLGLQLLGSAENRADDGPLGVLARLVGGPGLVPPLATVLSPAQLEAALPVLANVVLGLAPGRTTPGDRSVAEAAAFLAALGALGGGVTGTRLPGLAVAPLLPGKGPKAPHDVPPRSLPDVLRQVDLTYEGVPGAVSVQRIDHEDGTRSWVVAIPGTQEAGFGGPTTTDMASNLELLAGVPDDRTETVRRAMLQAGIRPDEPVLLAGHSQGGMAAMRVAASVGDSFMIAGVLTAGSPVGGMWLPDDIPALHLENQQDFVPAADAAPNPDQINRTTVVRDLSVPVAGAELAGERVESLGDLFLVPHELTTYIETAELVADLDDRSVTTFLDAVAPVLDDGAADVTTQRYIGVRVPDDASGIDRGVAPGVCLPKPKATSWS